MEDGAVDMEHLKTSDVFLDDSAPEIRFGKYIRTGGKRTPVSCSYCQRDITLNCRIHCAQCVKVVDLCTDCFASGVSFEDHVNTHDYQVVDCIDFPIFAPDWTAQEELLLLEAIEKCGFGNWKTIADYISSKNAKQVEDHVYDVYLKLHGYCLPLTFIRDGSIMATSEYLASNKNSTHDGSQEEDLMTMNIRCGFERGQEVFKDRASRDTGSSRCSPRPLSASATTAQVSSSSSSSSSSTIPATSDLPGFLPLREDFDVEHENDAENLLADMEFSPDDHISERELKLQVIRIYYQKLDERNRRKRFVIDRGLVDIKKQQSLEKKRTKEERELVARLRMFARFHSPEEHEALVDGILKSRRLKSQIEILQLYRSMGIRTLEQAKVYEADRRKKEHEQKMRKQKETSYFFDGLSDLNSVKRNKRASDSFSAVSSEPDVAVVDELSKAPGAALLSKKELDLCQKIHIMPFAYIALKDALVREAFRCGILTLEGVNRVLRLTPEQNSIIFDFFVTSLDINGSKEAASINYNPVSSADYVQTPEEEVRRGPGRKRKI